MVVSYRNSSNEPIPKTVALEYNIISLETYRICSYPSIALLPLWAVLIIATLVKRESCFVDILVHKADNSNLEYCHTRSVIYAASDANLIRLGFIIAGPQKDLPDYLGSLGTGEEILSVLQDKSIE